MQNISNIWNEFVNVFNTHEFKKIFYIWNLFLFLSCLRVMSRMFF